MNFGVKREAMRYIYNWLKKKNSKVFYGFIISYVMVILIPIIIGGSAWFMLMGNFSDEVEEIHKAVLRQVRITVDEQLTGVEKMSQQLAINPYVNQLLTANQPVNEEVNYRMKDIATDIANAKAVNNLIIDDCYMWFDNAGVILNSTSRLSPEMFYGYVNSYNGMSYDEWYNQVLCNKDSTVYLSKACITQGYSYDTVIISRKIENGRRNIGRLVIHLKKEYLARVIGEIDSVNNSVVCIIDPENRLIYSNDEKGAGLLDIYDFENNSISYDKEEWNVRTSDSESLIPGIKYVIFTPESELMRKVNNMRSSVVVAIILIALIGSGIIIFFAKRNYEPIKNLITNLERLNSNKNTEDSEYLYIMESLRSIYEEKNEMLETIGTQNEMVREKFFSEVLKGNTEDTMLGSGVDIFGLKDGESYFLVTVLIPGDCVIGDSMYNEIKNEIQKLPDVICTRIENKIALITSFDDCDYVGESDNEAAMEIKDIAARYGLSGCSVGTGGVQHGYMNIYVSYRQACIAAENAGADGVLNYHEIENKTGFCYPIETETRILNYIKNNDVTSAKRLIDEAVDNNLGRVSLEQSEQELFKSQIIGTVRRIIQDFSSDEAKHLQVTNHIGLMMSAKSTDEFLKLIRQFFADIEEVAKNRNIGHGEGMKKRIIGYIDEHYNQTSFSLGSMAEHFNITPSYLSRYFKENFGENFNAYLSGYKIEKAKKMLDETNYAIKEISALVGYYDVNNFIKTFKRIEGVTPGQYRSNRSGKV